MNVVDIVEQTYLKTYADAILGDIVIQNYSELEKEIRRRIYVEHNIDLIAEMKNYSGDDLSFETLSPLEIANNILNYIRQIYIPGIADLKNELLHEIPKADRDIVNSNREKFDDILQTKIEDGLKNLTDEERQTKKALFSKELLNPSYATIKKYTPNIYEELYNIASKIYSIPEEHLETFKHLKRQKVILRLGKMGNIATTTFGFSNSGKSQINDIIEVLMCKSV